MIRSSSAVARYILDEAALRLRNQRELLPTGISEFDRVLGGFPRGAITELYGPATSGKTSFLNNFLSHATSLGEYSALVDGRDTFDLASATAKQITPEFLLWVRCRLLEHAIKAADLLIHGGGWGVIALDLSDIPAGALRKVPASWWYRFQRAIERTPTALVILEREPYVRKCAALSLELHAAQPLWSGDHARFRILKGVNLRIVSRKPIQPEEIHVRMHSHF